MKSIWKILWNFCQHNFVYCNTTSIIRGITDGKLFPGGWRPWALMCPLPRKFLNLWHKMVHFSGLCMVNLYFSISKEWSTTDHIDCLLVSGGVYPHHLPPSYTPESLSQSRSPTLGLESESGCFGHWNQSLESSSSSFGGDEVVLWRTRPQMGP